MHHKCSKKILSEDFFSFPESTLTWANKQYVALQPLPFLNNIDIYNWQAGEGVWGVAKGWGDLACVICSYCLLGKLLMAAHKPSPDTVLNNGKAMTQDQTAAVCNPGVLLKVKHGWLEKHETSLTDINMLSIHSQGQWPPLWGDESWETKDFSHERATDLSSRQQTKIRTSDGKC